jgi:hypothetical protein
MCKCWQDSHQHPLHPLAGRHDRQHNKPCRYPWWGGGEGGRVSWEEVESEIKLFTKFLLPLPTFCTNMRHALP